MLTPSKLNALPALPFSHSADLTAGNYTVPCHEEKELTASGPAIEHEIWFKTQPLDADLIARLHCLKLIAESCDQGFVSDEKGGNWTWFEIAILENNESKQPKLKDGIQLTWVSHENRFNTDQYGWEEGLEFNENHDLFRLLEEGDIIAVRLCARFKAWQIKSRAGFLVFDIGRPITRDPLRFGQTKNSVLGIQNIFREINNQIVPNEMLLSTPPKEMLFRAEMLTSANKRPLRVLSLDGGGVRGLAALKHLDAVMQKAAPGKKPCEIFDMIGGTSTGGFIAIMLGRLRMSIEDCRVQYIRFMDTVFPSSRWTSVTLPATGSKWDATALENCIKTLVKEQLRQDPDQVLLLDPDSAKTCKVFVTATRRVGANSHAPAILRSYENGLEVPELPGIKIWEAARATSAAPSYFAPLKVDGQEFLDGGLQANNPLGWVWNEVLSVFGPARPTNCFLSIGTGLPTSEAMPDVRKAWEVPGALAGIATNSEITNILFRSLINAFAPQPMGKKYWRFNVGDGLPDWVEEGGMGVWKNLEQRAPENQPDLDDVKAIKNVEKKAEEYIKLPGAQEMIAECSDALKK